MGEMADYLLERLENEEDEELEYHPTGRRKAMIDKPEYHPTIWTRANGEKIHYKEMNLHHLTNALLHMEKSLQGYGTKPTIYFNMLKQKKSLGGGLTDDQINALLDLATAKKPISMAVWNENQSTLTKSQYDLLFAMEDDGEAITLAVVDVEGDQEYPVLVIRRDGEMIPKALPDDSLLGPWNLGEILGQ